MGLLLWSLISTFPGSGPSAKEKEFIMENGIKGIASLLAVERTGTTVNNIHQYAFSFRVQPDSGSAFEMVRKKLIDPIYMPGISVGMRIPAYTIPGNEDQTLILWEKAGIGDAF
ncbi:hypothetical protein EDD80_101447 [Anseongella ginsenosidimutans]|uniref:Uncharacterized protein n=1 Tax=Anseongella ginsenosidimutans TaxID=496056 RepID=A0A4R3KWR5_9SPHI|nr:hypothetical protein EDD80_101447 [Anseongella ginsenosidimutans]